MSSEAQAIYSSEADAPPPAMMGTIRRGLLGEAERALLGIISDLQVRMGWCYASQRYLADALRIPLDRDRPFTERHVRRLITRLHAKGCLAIIRRHGHTLLCRVLRLPVDGGGEPVMRMARNGGQGGARHARPRTHMSGVPRTQESAPGRTHMSANINSSDRFISRRRGGGNPAEGGGDENALFVSRRYFNPLRQEHRRQSNGTVDYDNRSPQQRVADARRKEEILFVEYDGRARFIKSAKWSHDVLLLELAMEDSPGDCDAVSVPAMRVGGLKFWR